MRPLSPHLFWDTTPEAVDPQRHAAWLTKRVLEYGRWRDWQILLEEFGKDQLAKIVIGIRTLDPKAAAFCWAFFALPPTAFRCSTTNPSPTPSPNC